MDISPFTTLFQEQSISESVALLCNLLPIWTLSSSSSSSSFFFSLWPTGLSMETCRISKGLVWREPIMHRRRVTSTHQFGQEEIIIFSKFQRHQNICSPASLHSLSIWSHFDIIYVTYKGVAKLSDEAKAQSFTHQKNNLLLFLLFNQKFLQIWQS